MHVAAITGDAAVGGLAARSGDAGSHRTTKVPGPLVFFAAGVAIGVQRAAAGAIPVAIPVAIPIPIPVAITIPVAVAIAITVAVAVAITIAVAGVRAGPAPISIIPVGTAGGQREQGGGDAKAGKSVHAATVARRAESPQLGSSSVPSGIGP